MGTDDHVARTVAVYDAVADVYAIETSTHGPRRQRARFVRNVTKGGIILDAGCGSGRDAAYFCDKGFSVTGVDLSANLLAIAQKNAPCARFHIMDLRSLGTLTERFDGIWACASLLHLRRNEVAAVISDLFRLLVPGGILYVLVKKGDGEVEKIEPSIPGKARFYTLFTESELQDMLRHAGFTRVESAEWSERKPFAGGRSLAWVEAFAWKPK